ncbi:MAG: molecular chaperone GrpE [Phormidesmis sp. CAN_BIN44]|nr:molecular chaperone GrpE [Phormidesmis sp. CAN_BIN44]
MTDSNLIGFGIVLAIGCIALILSWMGEGVDRSNPPQDSELKITELQQQCQRLRDELTSQKAQLRSDFSNATFEQLQTLLLNYPSACKMAQTMPDLPARNLVALFTPLENLLQTWGIEAIGSPWQSVSYDPQVHQPDVDDIAVGERVYIRFVGYRRRDMASHQILCPAKVSRTLPATVSE